MENTRLTFSKNTEFQIVPGYNQKGRLIVP